jgi:hypothetical protein
MKAIIMKNTTETHALVMELVTVNPATSKRGSAARAAPKKPYFGLFSIVEFGIFHRLPVDEDCREAKCHDK